jgi:prevent-host-death family protein
MTIIIVGGSLVKKMAAGAFKAHCLRVMDEVQKKRETIVITKHGKPVVKIVPAGQDKDEIYGFLRGKVKIVGDVVSPILTPEEWGDLY